MLVIGIIVMLAIIVAVVVIALNRQSPGLTCGGLDGQECPFGYSCQQNNIDSVGMCISYVTWIKTWVYRIFPSLKPKTYLCTDEKWVDCMPPAGAQKPECSQDFLDWAEINCSDFRGAVY